MQLNAQLELADEIGVRPSFWRLFLKRPKLALVCFFGPALPVHYRLCGPGKWEKAEEETLKSYHRALYTPSYGKSTQGKRSWLRKMVVVALFVGTIVGLMGAVKAITHLPFEP